MIIFWILFIGLVCLTAYLVFLLFGLWKSVRALFGAGSGFAQAFSVHALPHLRQYVKSRSVFECPDRRTQAALKHRQLVEQRQEIRAQKLSRAVQRWDDAEDFETRFSSERREEARRIREENRK
ncbi:hypothetical protein JOD55_001247 [Arcanobacterium pluranimalium]|uniref:hypothetical protein n=1 Tax=Arcanobacterium pluranimalium TaxID=108028 RepID=UPI00195DB72F|nr:hypothetical protein [Arcanobacterium pluranimalium]MBM7825420.1 hypothetical protein [Arcanobacterium pluranimalium]